MITPAFILFLIVGYFFVLMVISFLVSKEDSNETFFTANRNSPWYLVAFGMVGASLSGVTFISVPGWVQASQFTYFLVVLGYDRLHYSCLYFAPVFNNNVTSIYEYLQSIW